MTDIPSPTQYGSSDAVHQHCGPDVISVPLYDHENHVRAYELHGRDGPYLLTCAAYDAYLTLCQNSPR